MAASPPSGLVLGRCVEGMRRTIVVQAVIVGAIVLMVALGLRQAMNEMAAKNLRLSFDFLLAGANFQISDKFLSFDSVDPNWHAFLVGCVNVLFIGAGGSALATASGILLMLMRLSAIPALRVNARIVTDTVRSTPLLLQIVVLYTVFLSLPPPREAVAVADCLLLSNRGIYLPSLDLGGIGCPALAGFRVEGGVRISIELAALLFGVGLYGGAFIAEILRGSIGAIDKGQWEAAGALGLRRVVVFFKVILPQAVIASVPPSIGVFAGIFKNSSLGIAVGYSDLISISNSMITITGHAIEVVAMIIAYFWLINYAVTVALNRYNDGLLRKYGRPL